MTSSRRAEFDQPIFTASDAYSLAGISHRMLNDWEARGALPVGRDRGRGWRRFTARELFSIMACAELRDRLGVPVERLIPVGKALRKRGANHLESIAPQGTVPARPAWLVTDLDSLFRVVTQHQARDLAAHGLDAGQEAVAILRLDPLAEALLEWLAPDSGSNTGGERR